MITTTSLFNGCDLVDQFISENKDLFGNKDALFADSMVDDTLSKQEDVQLLKEKNSDVIASNIDNQDDNLVPGWYKISGYAGGGPLKGAKGETALGDLKGAISTFNTEKPVVGLKGQGVVSSNSSLLGGLDSQNSGPAITQEQYGSSDVVDFSYDSITDTLISGHNTNKITEEYYDSTPIIDLVEDSYSSVSNLSGYNSGATIIEESEIVEINSNDNRTKAKAYFNNLKDKLTLLKITNNNVFIEYKILYQFLQKNSN